MAIIMESTSLEVICTTLGETEKSLNYLIDLLEEWLKSQPHLPQDLSREMLEYFLIGTKMSLEQAKRKLDMFFTMKRLVPEVYAIRDPRHPSLDRLRKMMQILYLPKLTPENNRVCIYRPCVDDYTGFDVFDSLKYNLMIEELLMTESRSLGIIYIADHSMITLALLSKYTPAVLKKCEVILSEAYAKRIRGIHCVNSSPLTESLVVLVRKVLKPKLAARVHAYPNGDFESLYQHIPKSILPKDYGGDGPTIAHISEIWRQKLDDKRDWLIEQSKIMTNENLRPGPTIDGDDLFGFSGSFRKLDVD